MKCIYPKLTGNLDWQLPAEAQLLLDESRSHDRDVLPWEESGVLRCALSLDRAPAFGLHDWLGEREGY
jgi:hypothetical protein